jgi:hypothetical protein
VTDQLYQGGEWFTPEQKPPDQLSDWAQEGIKRHDEARDRARAFAADPANAEALSIIQNMLNGDPMLYEPGVDFEVDWARRITDAMLTTADLDKIPPPLPLIDGLLYCNSLAWLHGKPGHGKSFIALDWAGSVAIGAPWQRHETTRGPVVYIIAEGTQGLRQRVRAWEHTTGETMTGVRFLPIAVQMLEAPQLDGLIESLRNIEPLLVVVDTQARVSIGAEENSARDMGHLVVAVDKIRMATRACVLLVHHEARNGESLRGSTALEGAATSIFRVVKDGDEMEIKNTKQKDVPEHETVTVTLRSVLDSAVLSAQSYSQKRSKIEATILGSLKATDELQGASTPTLIEISKIPRGSLWKPLNALVRDGLVENTGTEKRAFWKLTSTGCSFAASLQLRDFESQPDGVARSSLPIDGVGSELQSSTGEPKPDFTHWPEGSLGDE